MKPKGYDLSSISLICLSEALTFYRLALFPMIPVYLIEFQAVA